MKEIYSAIASETLELAKALNVSALQNPNIFVEIFKFVCLQNDNTDDKMFELAKELIQIQDKQDVKPKAVRAKTTKKTEVKSAEVGNA